MEMARIESASVQAFVQRCLDLFRLGGTSNDYSATIRASGQSSVGRCSDDGLQARVLALPQGR